MIFKECKLKCRHCHAELQHHCLDLGTAPPSNAYLTPERLSAPEVFYPLRLLFCAHCYLVQTEDFTQRESMFDEDYAYFSSYSSSWLQHAQKYVETMCARFSFNHQSMVVEVAANDGYLLQYVKARNIPCYGIEPTASTARAAKQKGIDIVEQFFGHSLAMELCAQGRQADLMVANNVLAHVPDLNDFVRGFATLLKPQGVATFEFPHLLTMVQSNQFDTAYHEHFSYLSLIAVSRLFEQHGLSIFDVESLPTHGGSLRVYAQTGHAHQVRDSVAQHVQIEKDAGMQELEFYLNFQAQAVSAKNALLIYLLTCQQQGISVAAYGAAAKGNTFLNFAGIRSDLISFVVDKNPQKQGKFLPGSRIPIVDIDFLKQHQPQRIVIFPWNLEREIVEELSFVREWQGQFVVAIPKLRIF